MPSGSDPSGPARLLPQFSEGPRGEGPAREEVTGPTRVVSALPDVAALRKTFYYTVPEPLESAVRLGTRVRVVLNGRRVGAWVVDENVTPPPGVALRAIESVQGWGPPPSVLSLAQWASWRWAGPASAFLKAASPSRRVTHLLPAAPGAGSPTEAGAGSPKEDRLSDMEAFSGGTTIVRLGPATDVLPFVSAASVLLRGAPAGSGVLVLVPEHSEASSVASRLRKSGSPVALLPGDWAAARAGGCIAVGTRAAALAPLPRLAGAVVLDAHDEAYYEERAPTWSAWEMVAERARRDGCPCALVSACPTLDLLEAGRLVTPSRLDERRGWPALEIVDRRAEDPRKGLFSERLVSLVRWAAQRPGRRVLCVLNRTGRVRLVACDSCRELARCERCNGSVELVDEEGARMFRCRRCTAKRPVVCGRCGAGRMRALHVGVSRAREEIEALAGTRVAEVSGPLRRERGHLRVEGGAGAAPPEVANSASDVLDAAVVVGTEAVLHRCGAADAVAFLDFDHELLAPRMRAAEEALSMIARAGRIVGSSSELAGASNRAPGRVLVQTRLPGHDVLVAASSADPGRLQVSERTVRQELGLPPFSALALVSGPSAETYVESLRGACAAGVEVSGPVDGRWSVKASTHTELCALLAAVSRPSGRLRIEVDPVRA